MCMYTSCKYISFEAVVLLQSFESKTFKFKLRTYSMLPSTLFQDTYERASRERIVLKSYKVHTKSVKIWEYFLMRAKDLTGAKDFTCQEVF